MTTSTPPSSFSSSSATTHTPSTTTSTSLHAIEKIENNALVTDPSFTTPKPNSAPEKIKKKEEKKNLLLKTPKGTTDFGPDEMALRTHVFNTLIELFERHGAVTLDTPVFELTHVLQGKYGEDSKLIYDLKDQGGEHCSLRYDLTVPLARYLAMHTASSNTPFKRYHLGKVYRRDQPAMTKGRRREFYQCDFDIVGQYDPMIPEAELVYLILQVIQAFPLLGEVQVHVNHRALLNAMFEVCGVASELFKPIASAIDKLDKLSWEEVKIEMASKGLAVTSIDLIHHFVTMKGKKEIIDYLRTQTSITQTHALGAALDELELLLEYLEVFGVQDKVVLDLSLARGLDYYTGVIFEAVLVNEPTTREIREKKPSSSSSSSSSKSKTTQVDDDVSEDVGIGSIAAGGRYDDLVGTLAGPSKKGGDLRSCPCVGLSIGVERLCAVLWQRQCRYPSTKTQVYVMSVGSNVDGGYIKERMQLCQCLWDAKIPATFMYKCKPRLQSQFTQCEKEKIPWAVLIGEDELKSGHVRIKKMSEKSVGPEAAGILVKRDQMVMELKKRLTATSTTSTHDVEQMGVTLEQCKV